MTADLVATLDWVRAFIERFGSSPTYREIGVGLGITHVAALKRVEQLISLGKLRKISTRARGLDLVDAIDLRSVESGRLRAELARRGETVGALAVPERRAMGRRAVCCALDGCDIEVKIGHLMCRDHWFAVSRDLQVQLLRAHSLARRTRDPRDAARYGELFRQACDEAASLRRDAA